MDENPHKAPAARGSPPRESKSRVLDKTLALKLAMFCLTIAVAIFAFGFWGMFTKAGNHRFDEMDGMILLFAICVIIRSPPTTSSR